MGTGFEIRGDEILIKINPKVYSPDRVYATAYIFLDEFYIVFDGDTESEMIVRAKPKNEDENLEKFGNLFLEELLSISNYFNQLENNKELVNTILKRALTSLEPIPFTKKEQEKVNEILQK